MKLSNQQGIAHVAALLAAVLVIAIGGVGYLVFTNNDKDASTNATPSTTTTSSQETGQDADEAAVKTASKDFFSLIYAQKHDEAYQSTCAEFKDLTTYDEYLSLVTRSGFKTVDLSVVEFASVDVRNSQAKLIGPVGPLIPDADLTVTLLKKDSQWCIYGFGVE